MNNRGNIGCTDSLPYVNLVRSQVLPGKAERRKHNAESLSLKDTRVKSTSPLCRSCRFSREQGFPPLKKGGQGGFWYRSIHQIPLNPPFPKGDASRCSGSESLYDSLTKEGIGEVLIQQLRAPLARLPPPCPLLRKEGEITGLATVRHRTFGLRFFAWRPKRSRPRCQHIPLT